MAHIYLSKKYLAAGCKGSKNYMVEIISTEVKFKQQWANWKEVCRQAQSCWLQNIGIYAEKKAWARTYKQVTESTPNSGHCSLLG